MSLKSFKKRDVIKRYLKLKHFWCTIKIRFFFFLFEFKRNEKISSVD